MQSNLAYLAGLVDADGCITMKTCRSNEYVLLMVTGTHAGLAEWLQKNFGGNVRWMKRVKAWWKPEFIWRVSHQKAADLVDAMEPLLVVKANQAHLVQAFKYLPRGRKCAGKSRAFDEDTRTALSFMRTLMRMFNTRGANPPNPWPLIEAVANGERV